MAIFESQEEAVASAAARHAAGVWCAAGGDTKLGAGSVHLHLNVTL